MLSRQPFASDFSRTRTLAADGVTSSVRPGQQGEANPVEGDLRRPALDDVTGLLRPDVQPPGLGARRGCQPEVDQADGLLGDPPPGPATPVALMATSAPSRRADSLGHGRGNLGTDRTAGFDELRGHVDQGGLGGVGVADHASEVIGAHPGGGGDELGDQPARTGLGRRQRGTGSHELGEQGFGDVRRAFTQNHGAKTPVDLGGSRLGLQQGFCFGRSLAPDPEADRGFVSRDADLGHAAAGSQVHRLGLDIGLAAAEQINLTLDDDPVDPAALAEPWLDLFVVHHPHFGRDPRETGEGCLAQLHPDARRRADAIGQRLGALGEEGLDLVAFRHRPVPPGEHRPDRFERLGIFPQRDSGRCGQSLASQVVLGWPQPPGHDHELARPAAIRNAVTWSSS